MTAAPSPAAANVRVLVACIGNIFFGDDGFGVAVAERLASRVYPPDVAVVDFGIRGVELAYTLLDGCDTLILVDAVPRGSAPGTLYLLEIEPDTGTRTPARAAPPEALDAHSMDPVRVLAFARMLGARPRRALLVGCEPCASSSDNDLSMELSAPVRAAVDGAVEMIERLIV